MNHVVAVLDCVVIVLRMVAWCCPSLVVTMLVEVDLHVVVPWLFRHLVVVEVVIGLYELVVSLSVHRVHYSNCRLTVLIGVYDCGLVLAICVPLVVLVVRVLGILCPHWLMCVHCLVVLVLLVVQIVVPFVHLVAVLHCRH